MTNSTPDIPILDDDSVAEIEARYKAATPGPWAVWDSCSWRRIGTVEPFRDGNVICPIIQNDGHPDLLAKRVDLEFAAHARADIPALCATVRVLRAENERLIERLAQEVAGRVNTNAERLERSQRFTQSEINDHCSDDRLTDEQRGSYQG